MKNVINIIDGIMSFSYDECYEKALLCNNLEEFFEKYPDYYDCAHFNGYFEDCNWFKKMCFPCNYWTNEKIMFAAKRCIYKKEFHLKYPGAYKRAQKTNMLKSFDWFRNTEHNSLDDTTVIQISKKYITLKDFRDNDPKCYNYANNHKLLQQMSWLKSRFDISEWNNKERCAEVAKQCKNVTLFRNKFHKAYNYSKNNGWLNDFFNIKDNSQTDCSIKVYYLLNNEVMIGFYSYKTNIFSFLYRLEEKCRIKCIDISTLKNEILIDNVKYAEKNATIINQISLLEESGYIVLNKTSFWTKRNDEEIDTKIKKCIELSKQFSSWSDFDKVYHKECQTIRHYKRTKDCPWLFLEHINYTFDECRELVKPYNTRTELLKNNSKLYHYISNLGWLSDLIETNAKPKGYWVKYVTENLNDIYEMSKSYKTLKDFAKDNNRIYRAMCDLKLTENLTWLRVDKKPNGYWNVFENCAEISKDCKTFTEFMKCHELAYKSCKRNGWFDKLTWLKKETNYDMDKKEHWVYVYEDIENKAAYIGRTKDKNRHHNHNFNKLKNGKYDTVKRYFLSIGVQNLPEPIIVKTDLNAELSLYWEDEIRKQYENDGWYIINKAKTGVKSGSLGYTKKKWDYDSVYALAKTCKYGYELAQKSYTAYEFAKDNGYLELWDWLLSNVSRFPYHKWSEEYIIDYLNSFDSKRDATLLYKHIFTYALNQGYDINLVKWYKPKSRK